LITFVIPLQLFSMASRWLVLFNSEHLGVTSRLYSNSHFISLSLEKL
jgi:hypothetical protein